MQSKKTRAAYVNENTMDNNVMMVMMPLQFRSIQWLNKYTLRMVNTKQRNNKTKKKNQNRRSQRNDDTLLQFMVGFSLALKTVDATSIDLIKLP